MKFDFLNKLYINVEDVPTIEEYHITIINKKDTLPLTQTLINNNHHIIYNEGIYKTYIDYIISIHIIENGSIKKHLEYIFDPTDKNILIELSPSTQTECDIWTDYLENNFIKITKSNLDVTIDGNFNCKNNLKIIDQTKVIRENYYSGYKVTWDEPYLNPKTSYELINNTLLKL